MCCEVLIERWRSQLIVGCFNIETTLTKTNYVTCQTCDIFQRLVLCSMCSVEFAFDLHPC